MEQIQNQNRVASAKRGMLAEARALELEAKHPQISMYNPDPDRTEPMPIVGSGNEAGLRRVIGRGRKSKKMMARSPSPAPSTPEPEMEEMSGGAKHGMALAHHMKEQYGAGFLDDFAKGFMSVIRPVAKVASFIPGPIGAVARGVSALSGGAGKQPGTPTGLQVAHARMDSYRVGEPGSALGGQDVPPGGEAPIAYGNVPQAPASFARNSVGMGRAGGGTTKGMMRKTARRAYEGMGNLHITHMGEGRAGGGSAGGGRAGGAKRKPSARGMMVSKLMKEKGMTLPEASRYLKEHGSA